MYFKERLLSASDIIDMAFPQGQTEQLFGRTPVRVNFAKHWALATKTVIEHLNDRLKIGSLKATRILQHIRNYTHDILTVDSIISKMRRLLADLELRFFPVFSWSTFWGYEGKFKLAQVLPSSRIRVLQIVNGKPVVTDSKEIIDNEAKLRVSSPSITSISTKLL